MRSEKMKRLVYQNEHIKKNMVLFGNNTEKELEIQIPILKIKRLYVIQGDNFHSLYLLKENFIYNDRIIDEMNEYKAFIYRNNDLYWYYR